VYSSDGELEEESSLIGMARYLRTSLELHALGDAYRPSPRAIGEQLRWMLSNDWRERIRQAKITNTSLADVVSFSGCRDSERLADAGQGAIAQVRVVFVCYVLGNI